MGTKLWFVITGWDEDRDETNTLVDHEVYYASGWPQVMEPNLAVFLVNEVIAEINRKLAEGVEIDVDDESRSFVPFLGTCRTCGEIFDNMHLYGPDSDVCDRCWNQGRR